MKHNIIINMYDMGKAPSIIAGEIENAALYLH